MRIRALLFIAIALVLAQTSFGATVAASAGISSCTNFPGAPFNIGGTLYAYFDCSLYSDVASYSFNLTPLMTDGGAALSDNVVGSAYFVVINGNPSTMTDDGGPNGLYNENLWETALYWPGDQGGGFASDTLDVYWTGAFPAASTVQSYDQALYGVGIDSDFFIQYTPPETVYQPCGPGCSDEYDVYLPEPGTILLLGSGLAMLGGVVLKRRRAAGRAA